MRRSMLLNQPPLLPLPPPPWFAAAAVPWLLAGGAAARLPLDCPALAPPLCAGTAATAFRLRFCRTSAGATADGLAAPAPQRVQQPMGWLPPHLRWRSLRRPAAATALQARLPRRGWRASLAGVGGGWAAVSTPAQAAVHAGRCARSCAGDSKPCRTGEPKGGVAGAPPLLPPATNGPVPKAPPPATAAAVGAASCTRRVRRLLPNTTARAAAPAAPMGGGGDGTAAAVPEVALAAGATDGRRCSRALAADSGGGGARRRFAGLARSSSLLSQPALSRALRPLLSAPA